jgi:putative Holliday junction resolvase
MLPGVRLGIDVGKARVGIARSDPGGLLATPVETSPREHATARVLELAREFGAVELVVGLPLSLSGVETPSTQDARDFANELLVNGSVPVRLVDERLSTVSAQGVLSSQGHSAKKQRAIVDQAAAVIILQHLLDSVQAQGRATGELLNPTGSVDD